METLWQERQWHMRRTKTANNETSRQHRDELQCMPIWGVRKDFVWILIFFYGFKYFLFLFPLSNFYLHLLCWIQHVSNLEELHSKIRGPSRALHLGEYSHPMLSMFLFFSLPQSTWDLTHSEPLISIVFQGSHIMWWLLLLFCGGRATC